MHRNFYATCILFALTGMLRGQELNEFRSRYLMQEERLYQRYSINRKVVTKYFSSDGQLHRESELVNGRANSHLRHTFTKGGQESIVTAEDNQHKISDINKKPRISFHGGYKAIEFGFPFLGIDRLGFSMKPLQFFDMSEASSIGDLIRFSELSLHDAPRFRIDSVAEESFHGKKAIAIIGQANSGPTGTVYLDRDKLIYLGFVNKKEGYEGLLTYDEKPGEELPLPKEFVIWKIDVAGKKTVHSREVVVEYVDYSPSAEEFDIEKRYGLKPLPPKYKLRHDTAAHQNKRNAWGPWLYGLGIALAILSIAIWWFVRKKK
jgi:hypothetical protein